MLIYTLNGEKTSEDLKVWINDEIASVYSCLVSKDPINRRWPGHQREISQCETAYFTSFESDAPVRVRVSKYKAGKAVVRPLYKEIETEELNDSFVFTLKEKGQYSFEIGDYHNNLHIFFNEVKTYDLDGDVIRFENGVFDVGEIYLKSNQTLYVDKTAVLYANIVVEGQENVKIMGGGIIDNSHSKETILFEAEQGAEQVDVGNAIRKHFIHIRHSKNIEIRDVILRDSLCYTVATLEVDGIRIDNIKIVGNWRYNSDGIDLQNTMNALVENSFVRTYDDCICIKADKCSKKNCENTHYENMVLWCDWGHSFEIGYETCADEIKNITYRNCVSIRTNFDFINIGCVDYANIHDILYENIILEFTGDEREPQFQSKDGEEYSISNPDFLPQVFGMGVFHHFEYSVGNEFGRIHDIHFKNIRIINGKNVGIHIAGADKDHLISNVTFENVILNGKKIESEKELKGEVRFAENIKVI